MAKREVSGPFAAQELGGGSWHLSAHAPAAVDVYLEGTGPEAAAILADAQRLAIEWHGRGVTAVVTGADGTRRLSARSAVIQQPLARLYESLPLAGFDAGARRFWRGVFLLLRIPGGRHLLKYVARRRAGRTSGPGTAAQ
jgi:hypothetical protein